MYINACVPAHSLKKTELTNNKYNLTTRLSCVSVSRWWKCITLNLFNHDFWAKTPSLDTNMHLVHILR